MLSPVFKWDGIDTLPSALRTPPLKGEVIPPGYLVIPLPSFSAKPKNPPSPLGRLIASAVAVGNGLDRSEKMCMFLNGMG